MVCSFRASLTNTVPWHVSVSYEAFGSLMSTSPFRSFVPRSGWVLRLCSSGFNGLWIRFPSEAPSSVDPGSTPVPPTTSPPRFHKFTGISSLQQTSMLHPLFPRCCSVQASSTHPSTFVPFFHPHHFPNGLPSPHWLVPRLLNFSIKRQCLPPRLLSSRTICFLFF